MIRFYTFAAFLCTLFCISSLAENTIHFDTCKLEVGQRNYLNCYQGEDLVAQIPVTIGQAGILFSPQFYTTAHHAGLSGHHQSTVKAIFSQNFKRNKYQPTEFKNSAGVKLQWEEWNAAYAYLQLSYDANGTWVLPFEFDPANLEAVVSTTRFINAKAPSSNHTQRHRRR